MKGKVSKAQTAYHKRLREQGYAVAVCYGAENAIKLLDYYLADEGPPF
jgi:ribosomal protein L25 (general stress protein Ctc)